MRTATSAASIDGVPYTRIVLDHDGRFSASFETVALDGSGEAARRINATLAEPLAGDPPEWFDCIRTPPATALMKGIIATASRRP